jgi:type III pantothenate kinase
MMLTIDIGNSCIKYGLWQQQHLSATGSVAYRADTVAEALERLLTGVAKPPAIYIACVGGAEVERDCADWFQLYMNIEPVFMRTTASCCGVVNAYADPAQHGVDRWAALIGARSLLLDPVCIIDCGTAVTVDLMDATGRHLGGRIMPGLEMMQQALLQRASGIHQVAGNVEDFASNTADAVSSGTLHMLHAALIEVTAAARQWLGESMKVLITGGAAQLLISLEGLPLMRFERHLVLTGIHTMASR